MSLPEEEEALNLAVQFDDRSSLTVSNCLLLYVAIDDRDHDVDAIVLVVGV